MSHAPFGATIIFTVKTTEELLKAINNVVRYHRKHSERESVKITCAIESISQRIRIGRGRIVNDLRKKLKDAKFSLVDPSEMQWNVFQLFGREDHEPSWTQWIASILSKSRGEEIATIAWSALCLIASKKMAGLPDDLDQEYLDTILAQSDDWIRCSMEPPEAGCVWDEHPDPILGIADIVVHTRSMVVVIENKLKGGWHNRPTKGSEEHQADRMRKLGKKLCARGQKLGLILLSNRDFDLDNCPWQWRYISYFEFGSHLRSKLRPIFQERLDFRRAMALWPLLISLVAIEQDLLNLGLENNENDRGWLDIVRLAKAAKYLGVNDERY